MAVAVGSAAEDFLETEITPLLARLEMENRRSQRLLTLAEVSTYMRPYIHVVKQLNDMLHTILKVSMEEMLY